MNQKKRQKALINLHKVKPSPQNRKTETGRYIII